jgi:hypothetical protein
MGNLLIEYGAEVSDCGKYRWSLYRCWDHSLPLLGWIMLNPSTADAMQDDPTIRRCMGFAKDRNFGGIEVRNLFAWRATNPKELQSAFDAVGEKNDDAIRDLTTLCPKIVCAWGAHDFAKKRATDVIKMLYACCSGWGLVCLGVTKNGHPKHPLYVPANAELILWPQT